MFSNTYILHILLFQSLADRFVGIDGLLVQKERVNASFSTVVPGLILKYCLSLWPLQWWWQRKALRKISISIHYFRKVMNKVHIHEHLKVINTPFSIAQKLTDHVRVVELSVLQAEKIMTQTIHRSMVLTSELWCLKLFLNICQAFFFFLISFYRLPFFLTFNMNFIFKQSHTDTSFQNCFDSNSLCSYLTCDLLLSVLFMVTHDRRRCWSFLNVFLCRGRI